MKIGAYAVTTSIMLAFNIVMASADLLPQRVSGYEYFIGIPCTIDGQAPPVTSNSQAGQEAVGRWPMAGGSFRGMGKVRGQRS